MFHGHFDYFQNHLLEADRTQNQETMALRTLTTCDLLYLIVCDDPHEYRSTIVGLLKHNLKNKKRKNYEIMKTEKQN